MADGFSFTGADQFEVVVTYTAAQQTVQGVASGTGWTVVGGFEPSSNVEARVEIVGSVSKPGLTMTARVWEVAGDASGALGGAANISTESPSSAQLASPVTFQAGRIYQLQVSVVGDAADDAFGIIHSVTLVP